MEIWNYLWHFIFSLLCGIVTATHLSGSTAGVQGQTSSFLFATSLSAASVATTVGSLGPTDNEPTGLPGTVSSSGVSSGSQPTSAASTTLKPDVSSTSMATESGSAGSEYPAPSSTAHSDSPLLAGSSPEPSSSPPSSSSDSTEAGLTKTSQPLTAVTSSGQASSAGTEGAGSVLPTSALTQGLGTAQIWPTSSSTDGSLSSTALTSAPSQASSNAAATVRPDAGSTSMATESGGAGSQSPTPISAAHSDSPLLASSSPEPSSSPPSSSSDSTESGLTKSSQPSTTFSSLSPASSGGFPGAVTVMPTSAHTQGQATAQVGPTSSSTDSLLSSTALASAPSVATSFPGTGGIVTVTHLSGSTADVQGQTSSFLFATSLSAASVATTVGSLGPTDNEPTGLPGTVSSSGVSSGSQPTSAASTTLKPDVSSTSMATESGSAGSEYPAPSSTAHSDSPLLAGSSPEPSSSPPSSSSDSTEAGLTKTSQPLTAVTSSGQASSAGTEGAGSVLPTSDLTQGLGTAQIWPTSSSTDGSLSSTALTSAPSQASSNAAATVRPDAGSTSMATESGGAGSQSPTPISAAHSDSPLLASSSPEPSSSPPSSSSDSTEAGLTKSSQPSTTFSSFSPASSGGFPGAVTVMPTSAHTQGQATAQVGPTSSSTDSLLSSTALASAPSVATSFPGTGGIVTATHLSGSTADVQGQTSSFLFATSLSAASVATTVGSLGPTDNEPTGLPGTVSSSGVSSGSQPTSAASTTLKPDVSSTSMATESGSAGSEYPAPSSTAHSDSPLLAGSSPEPSSSPPSSSSDSTEAGLTKTSQPLTAVTSSGQASSAGTEGAGSVLPTSALTQGLGTAQIWPTSSSTDGSLSSTALTSAPSQASSNAAATVRPDAGSTSMATESGGAGSQSPTPISAAHSDSPLLASSSPEPSSSPPSSSSDSTEAGLTKSSQPSTTFSSFSPASSGGFPGAVTVMPTSAHTQGQATAQVGPTSSSTDSLLSSTALASAPSVATSFPGTGGIVTATHLSGSTADVQGQTSSFLFATSLSAASVATTVGSLGPTDNEPTGLPGTVSSSGVSSGSQPTSAASTTLKPDVSSTSMATESGSAGSEYPAPSSTAHSDSPLLASSPTLLSATRISLSSVFLSSLEPTSVSEFSPSTLNIPSSPGFCSPVTLSIQPEAVTSRTIQFSWKPQVPVSIKVENVTGEAIQISWTTKDDRRGSLYTIFLMDGIQEINKTATDEMAIIFKHLLPGHVYTVSVEISSCAENSRTSVSVRTDPISCFSRTDFCLQQNHGCSDLNYIICSNYQTFACRALLKNQTFNDSLYDTDSEEYKAMSKSIKTEIVTEMRIKLKDDHFNIMVLGFRPGSVIADFISVLQKQEPVDVNVMREYLSQILKSKFGDQTELEVQSLSTQSSTGRSSAWKVAVIVLGVLLGVALVIIFLLVLFYILKKRSSGKYLVEPTGLLGNFVYKHL